MKLHIRKNFNFGLWEFVDIFTSSDACRLLFQTLFGTLTVCQNADLLLFVLFFFIFCCCFWVTGATARAGRFRCSSPRATSTNFSSGMPKCSKASRDIQSSHLVLGLPGRLFLDGHSWNNSPWRCPGDILTRCLNHLNWLLSTWRSNSSTLSFSRMSELLTLSLWLSSATLQGKLISAACIRELILSSLPRAHDHRWKLGCRLTCKLKALPSGSALSSP